MLFKHKGTPSKRAAKQGITVAELKQREFDALKANISHAQNSNQPYPPENVKSAYLAFHQAYKRA